MWPWLICICILASAGCGGGGAGLVDEFSCAVCTELLAAAHSLACGHSFCFLCITRWFEARRAAGDAATCPTCRAPVRSHGIFTVCFTAYLLQSDGRPHGVRALDAAVAAHARGMGATEVASYTRRAGEGQRAVAAASPEGRLARALARESRVLLISVRYCLSWCAQRTTLASSQICARTSEMSLSKWVFLLIGHWSHLPCELHKWPRTVIVLARRAQVVPGDARVVCRPSGANQTTIAAAGALPPLVTLLAFAAVDVQEAASEALAQLARNGMRATRGAANDIVAFCTLRRRESDRDCRGWRGATNHRAASVAIGFSAVDGGRGAMGACHEWCGRLLG